MSGKPSWNRGIARALAVLCIGLLASPLPASAEAPAPAQTAAQSSVEAQVSSAAVAPFLWEVRKGATTHYLLGSVHLLPEAAHPLPAAIEAAYRRAGALVFESDLAALESAPVQQALLVAARGRGLRKEVPAALYDDVRASASRRGLAADVCDPYTAWFCAMLLELAAFGQQGFGAEQGIDQTFFVRARTDGKPIRWFETPSAHIGLFTQMGEALGADYLRSTLDDEQHADQQPQALFAAWQRDDGAFIEGLVQETREQVPALYETLLARRNRAWLPMLEAELRGREPRLIVVGAAHLYGDDGLLAALRARGYELRKPALATP